MRLPAMLLVVFSLLLFSIASPVPTENVSTSNISIASDTIASDSARPKDLSITWCFDPDHHCVLVEQTDRVCTWQQYFSNLRGIGMDIGIECTFFSVDGCSGKRITLGNNVDIRKAGVNFVIESTYCFDSRTGPASRSVATEVVDTADIVETTDVVDTIGVSVASVSDDTVSAKLDIEFCYMPEAHKDCQVLTQDNQRCASQQYLNDLKSVHMTDQQFCMFFSDDACKGTGDMMIIGSTDDVRAVGLTFEIQSSFCYDLNLGNLVFSKRSIDDIESAVSSDSQDADDSSNSITSQQDEHLVTRFPNSMNSRHVALPLPGRVDPPDTDVPTLYITMCYDDGLCNAEPMASNQCVVNYGQWNRLKGISMSQELFCVLFRDDMCQEGGLFVVNPTPDFVAAGLSFELGSLYCSVFNF